MGGGGQLGSGTNCLDSDAGPATLKLCDLGNVTQYFCASASYPQNGDADPGLGC